MALTLRQKVELYENTLHRLARIDPVEVEKKAMAECPDPLYKYAYALGGVGAALKDVVQDAQWTLEQGAK